MAHGDEALAGREEDLPGHRFAPTASDRTVYFKGYYISIVNKETDEQIAHEDNNLPSKEYREYLVPANFTCYVRGAVVYFKV